MLGNDSPGSRRSFPGVDSAGPPPELLSGPGGQGSGNRSRKRRLEDVTDPRELDVSIRAIKSVFEDLSSHAKEPGGLVAFAGTPDLLVQLERGTAQLALLWRPTKDNDSRLDDVDDIASGIWNLSINAKGDDMAPGRSQARTTIAELRACAYTLIELCETQKDDVNGLLKLLTLGTMVGRSFFGIGDYKKAADAYHRASLIYERISASIANQGKTKSVGAISQAFLSLCLHRAELAFEMGNNHNAHHLISRALDRDIFAHAKAPFVQTLAETEIAFARKLVARSDYGDAGKWARKAIDLLDNDQEGDHKLAAPILAPLRQTALKLLATALVYSGVLSNLDLAGNAIELAQQSAPHDAGLYFLSLKKQTFEGVPDETKSLKLCEIALRNVDFADENAIRIIMAMLHQCVDHCSKRRMVQCFRHLMEKSRAKGHHDLAEQLLCAICNLLVAQPDPALSVTECCRIFEEVYIAEESSGTKVSAATASACQMTIWRSADGAFLDNNVRDALVLFETSKTLQIQSMDSQNQQILIRRIADCHLRLGNFPAARQAVQSFLDSNNKQPNTLRLLFEIDLQEGKIEDCRRDIEDIALSPDTDEAVSALGHVSASASQHPRGSELLVEAIQRLIQLHHDRSLPVDGKILSLYRKLIQSGEQAVAGSVQMDQLKLFEQVVKICESDGFVATESQQAEIQWLARHCWNSAVGVLDDCERSARYFDLAYALLSRARDGAGDEEAVEFWKRSLLAVFGASGSNVEHARSLVDDAEVKKSALLAGLDRLSLFRSVLDTCPYANALSTAQIQSKALLIEFEARLGLGQYTELQKFITQIDEEMHWTTLEMMVDMAIQNESAPSGIQFLVIQVTLDAILRQDEIDSTKFAGWMRILIITALSKNQTSALQFFGQILDVMDDSYPEVEIEWLVVQAWNVGVDAMSTGNEKKAKEWCETAIKFLPRLATTRDKYEASMGETYTKLLEMGVTEV